MCWTLRKRLARGSLHSESARAYFTTDAEGIQKDWFPKSEVSTYKKKIWYQRVTHRGPAYDSDGVVRETTNLSPSVDHLPNKRVAPDPDVLRAGPLEASGNV
jgi:hypothetical protein